MKVVIVEDEKPAVDKLKHALGKSDFENEIVAVLKTIRDSVVWFRANPMPDLIFMDIELADGLSFKIFEQVQISTPVIFTTAYDEYWQEAFEHNSIDYLLKPIKQEKLEAALAKYENLKRHFSTNLQQMLQRRATAGETRKRFLVKRGVDYVSIKTEEVAYFYATHKVVCLVDIKGNKYILDQSLSDLEKQVDSSEFFRINRKYLVQINAIKKIKTYPKSKILLEIYPPVAEDVIISQENVGSFKAWMGQ